MAPIRLAIIGLSSRASTSWASSAHLPYLLTPTGKEKYKIVALCNSSVDAAKAAIAHYKLGDGIAAYGDPTDLAKDDNVDLVVCNTRVDVHYDTIKPSIEAGKNVYVEWPLTHDFKKSCELVDLAASKKISTIIGLQRRFAPVVVRLKTLLHDQQTLGKVLSSSVTAYGGTIRRTAVPAGLKYFTDRKVGGNPMTIGLIHMLDYVQDVLGEYKRFDSQMQLQRPSLDILDPATGKPQETVTSDVPDIINIHGTLQPSPAVVDGATLTVHFRRGPPYKGQPAFVWSVYCEKGEVRLVNFDGPGLLGSEGRQPTIEVEKFDSDTVETLDWQWGPLEAPLPPSGRDVASVYEAYAMGNARVPDFDDARRRHVQVNEFFRQFDASSSS